MSKFFWCSIVLVGSVACGPTPEVTESVRAPLQATEAKPKREVTVWPANAPVDGRSITSWTKAWWKWTFAVPAARNPELVLDAPCGVGQDDDSVFFVPAYDGATSYFRSCRVPHASTLVLVPLWALINDYPCPDKSFHPAPGQSLEAFLTEGVVELNDTTQNLTVTVDDQPVDVATHRHTTQLFDFKADQSLVGVLPDACLQGTTQPGVSDGWWLMLSLGAGTHLVHVTAISPFGPIDTRYELVVGR